MSVIWTNFQLGLLASIRSLNLLVQQAIELQLMWGVIIGFAIGTIIYAILLTEKPSETLIMLWYDSATGFAKMNTQENNGSYVKSFAQFAHHVRALQLAINAGMVVVVALIIIGIVRF